MREYQHRHMVRTLVYSKVTILILFLLVVLLARSIMELNTKRKDVAALRDEAVEEKVQMEKKVRQAQQETDFINTRRGLEAYIRTTYPVVGVNEGVIVVYDDTKNPVSPVRSSLTIREKFLLLWKKVFSK